MVFVDNFRQGVGAEVGGAPDADGAAADAGDGSEVVVDFIFQFIDAPGLLQPEPALPGQNHGGDAAVEEGNPVELVLNLLDGGAQGRLGYIESLGCFGEVAFLAYRQDIFVIVSSHT